jgi:hypothetical protein
MALSINYKTDSGINISSAYCRIDEIFIAQKTKLSINVGFYASGNDVVPFHKEFFKTSYDHTASNPLEQGYEFLKNQPQFSESKDV